MMDEREITELQAWQGRSETPADEITAALLCLNPNITDSDS